MKRLLSITVRGHQKEWSFTFIGDVEYLNDWREDGLEINEVVNTCPGWLPSFLVKPWFFVQDIINFKWAK